ncbi:MAG: hypothetical protein FJW51_01780 [Actinobacteria bacterium]|nr:hypothetical protein [Actinomycetota bacterium]
MASPPSWIADVSLLIDRVVPSRRSGAALRAQLEKVATPETVREEVQELLKEFKDSLKDRHSSGESEPDSKK